MGDITGLLYYVMVEEKGGTLKVPLYRLDLFELRAVEDGGECGLLAELTTLKTLLGHARLEELLVGFLELLHLCVPGLGGGHGGRLHALGDFDDESGSGHA